MKLAIDGGVPARRTPFPAWPHHGAEERSNLLRALDQGQWWRISGAEVDAFEREFADVHGAARALAVTNGTHALELALLTLGIEPGDEVLVPGFTFISTSMAVQRVGAVPVPVDVGLDSYNMTAEAAAAMAGPRTKAAIPVHMAGNPADLDRLAAALGGGIALVQDAAHAHGMVAKGRRIGECGMACFSFQNFKLMTSGEGGAITFTDEDSYRRAFLRHNCGRAPTDRQYRHDVLGSNYRLGEFQAAILRAQLARLEDQNRRRERNHAQLLAGLALRPGLIPQGRAPWVDVHPHYMTMMRIDRAAFPRLDRDWLVAALVAEGLPAYRTYKPVYRTKVFWQSPCPAGDEAGVAARCPNTETIGDDGLWIHHRVLLGDEREVADVLAALDKVLEAARTGAR